MASVVQQNLVAKNSEYAAKFDQGHLPLPPAKKYLVVTCMDARIHAPEAFGISLGDAHIIRNGGGSARDALRSIIISEQLLGTTEVLLIKHTDCGMLTFKNEDARKVVSKNLGAEAGQAVQSLDFLPFGNLEDAVQEELKWLRTQKTIPESVQLSGWIYEVETGKVRQVK